MAFSHHLPTENLEKLKKLGTEPGRYVPTNQVLYHRSEEFQKSTLLWQLHHPGREAEEV